MLVKVLDAAGVEQTVLMPGQEVAIDVSGVIPPDGIAVIQDVTASRSGWYVQNAGTVAGDGSLQFNPMWVNELGEDPVDAATVDNGSILLIGGASLAAPRDLALTTNKVQILGTPGDTYIARVW